MSEDNQGALLVFGSMLSCDFISVVLIALKVRHIISWSWWLVTAPFWGQFVVIAVLTLVSVVVCGLNTLINKVKKHYAKNRDKI